MSEKNEYHLKMPERETYIRFSMADNICELDTLESKWIRHNVRNIQRNSNV